MQEISNEYCILVEFVHDERKIAVGFRSWCSGDYTDDQLNDFIANESELCVEWPKNVDIKPATTMKKILPNCEFSTLSIKLLAYGDWKKMCEKARNIEDFGLLSPSKHDRAKLKKRKFSESDSDDANINNNQKMVKKTEKKRQAGNKIRKSELLLNAIKLSKTDNTIVSSESEMELNIRKLSMAKLQERVYLLEEENKLLRRENGRLRTLAMLSTELPEILKITENIKDNLQKTKNLTKNVLKEKMAAAETVTPEPTSVKITSTNKETPLMLESTTDIAADDEAADVIAADDEAADVIAADDEAADVISGISKSSINDDEQVELLDTGVMLSKDKLDTVNTNSFSKLVNDLLLIVFGRDVLAPSSFSGKTSNAVKSNILNVKGKLDENKLDAIRRYAVSICGEQEDGKRLFKKIVRYKCNNISKAMKN